MTDLAGGLQQALYDQLSAEVTLGAVYQHVPQNTPPPVVIIGEFAPDNADAPKGSRLQRFEVSLAYVVRGPGRLPLFALMEEGRATLENREISAPGIAISRPVLLSATDQLLEDGKTYYGAQRFQIFVQPSD